MKDNNKFKNKQQPELPENWTVWKFNNQGIKEETFIQTRRRGRDGQYRQYRMCSKAPIQAVPHPGTDKLGGTTGEWDRPCNPGFQYGKLKPQNLWLWKPVGVAAGGRNCRSHRKVHWRGPWGPRMYISPPTQESAPEGPNLLVGSGGSDWKWGESQASSIVPSLTPPPYTAPQCRQVDCPALVNT